MLLTIVIMLIIFQSIASIGLLLLYIIYFGTAVSVRVIKHVWHSFEFLLCLPWGGGGYSHILTIQVCGTGKGKLVFKPFTLR